MTTKGLTSLILGIVVVLGMAWQSQPVSIQYDVTGTFGDGTTLTGTIQVDSALSSPVTAWNVITQNGTLNGVTYTSGNSTVYRNTRYNTIMFVGSSTALEGQTLRLGNYSPTLKNPGPYRIGFVTEWAEKNDVILGSRSGTGSVVGTTNIINPAPSSSLLLGTGLVLLGYWGYRKSQQQA